MLFDEGAYLNACRRVRFECYNEYTKSDISLKNASFPTLVYSAMKNACQNIESEAVIRLNIDGVTFEKVFERKVILTQIADFLVDNDNVEVSYCIYQDEINDADKMLHTITENKNRYMAMMKDIAEDDYIVLINFAPANKIQYIKVYPDGDCKYAHYSEKWGADIKDKKIILEKRLFNKLLSHTKSKVNARKKRDFISEGEYPIRLNESYYAYGFKAFGQNSNDYGYDEEKHYFDIKTRVKVLDELIRVVAPDMLEPVLLGLPALPRLFGGNLPGDYDPDEYDEDDLLGDPKPGYYYDEDDDDLDSLSTKIPSMDGKDKCETLREIRMKFAKDHNIDYEFKECTHDGPCAGTCPLCDKEARDLAEIAKERGIKYGEE